MIDDYIAGIRASEEQDFQRFLAGGETLCVVSGPAGSGKTSLVLWACAKVLTVYVKANENSGVNLVYEACLRIIHEINVDEQESGIKWRSLLKETDLGFLGRDGNLNNYGKKSSSGEDSPLILSKNANFLHSVRSLFGVFVKHIGKPVFFVFDDFQWCGREQQQLILDLIEGDSWGAKYILICRDGSHGQEIDHLLSSGAGYREINASRLSLEELSSESVVRFADELKKRNGSLRDTYDAKDLHFCRLPYEIMQCMESSIIDEFSPEQKYILFCCSVVGFRFDIEIVSLLHASRNHEFFENLVNKGVLKKLGQGRYCFGHDITFVRCSKFYSVGERNAVLRLLSSLIESDVENGLPLSASERASFLVKGYEVGHVPNALRALRVLSIGLEDANNRQNFQLMKEVYGAAIHFMKRVSVSEDVCEYAKVIAITCYYCDDISAMEDVAGWVINSKVSEKKKLDMYVVLIDGYLSKNMMLKTIDATKSALSLLGHELRGESRFVMPLTLAMYHVPKSILGMAIVSRDVSRACESEKERVTSQLLTKVCAAYYSTNYLATGQPIADVLWLSAKYGALPETAYAIGQWAFGIGGTLKMPAIGRMAFRLASRVISQHPNDFYRGRTDFLYHTFVGVHGDSIRKNVGYLEDVFYLNMRAGSLDIAAYCAHVCSFHALDSDFSLGEVKSKIVTFRKNLSGFTQQNASSWMNVVHQLVDDLRADAVGNTALEGAHFSLARDIPDSAYRNDRSIVFIANHYAGVWYTLIGKYPAALSHFEKACVFRDGVRGTYGEVLVDFYHCISKISLSLQDGVNRSTLKEELHLGWLSKSGSKSAASKYLVVKGYRAILARQYDEAVALLDRAIESARIGGHTLDGILALRAKIWIVEKVLLLAWTETHVELEEQLRRWGGKSLIAAYSLEDAKPFGQYVSALPQNIDDKVVERLAKKISSLFGARCSSVYINESKIVADHFDEKDCRIFFNVAMTSGAWATIVIEPSPGMDSESSKIIEARIALAALDQRTRNNFTKATSTNDVIYKKTNVGLIEINLRGDVIRANRRCLELTGNLDQEHAGTVTELFRGFADAHEIDQIFCRVQESGWESVVLQGKNLDVSLELSVALGDDGVFSCTVRDVTEKETLRIYKSLIVDRSARLSGLSHEIKNPLLSVEAQLDDCLAFMAREDGTLLFPELTSKIRKCKDSIETIASEMDDLIAIGRVDVEARKNSVEFNVHEMTEEILERWSELAFRHGLKMQVESMDPSRVIYTDKALLGMIVRNMVSNAIFHSKGTLFSINIFFEADQLCFTFSDNGVGMSPDLFNSQYKTTSPNGSGVGLVNCRMAAKLLGAQLQLAESPVGVTIRLEMKAPARVNRSSDSKSTLVFVPYIGIVEDDPRLLDLYQQWFSGWKLRIYSDLETAAREITQEAFDMVLVDCFLEDKSTEDYIRRLRELLGWRLPVIGCSANDSYRTILVRAGATYFVEKTSSKAVLENALLNILAHSSGLESYRSSSLDLVDRQIQKLVDLGDAPSSHALAPIAHSLGSVASLFYPSMEQDFRHFEDAVASEPGELGCVIVEMRELAALLRSALEIRDAGAIQ